MKNRLVFIIDVKWVALDYICSIGLSFFLIFGHWKVILCRIWIVCDLFVVHLIQILVKILDLFDSQRIF